MNGVDVRRWMVLRTDEHLDRVNPEECTGRTDPNNLSNRFVQRFSPVPYAAWLSAIATLEACWTPLLSCQPLSLPYCSQALQRRISPSLTAVPATTRPMPAASMPPAMPGLANQALFPAVRMSSPVPAAPLVSPLPVRPAGGRSMARDASRPDAFRRQRRAGTVKDAEGTAKRREP